MAVHATPPIDPRAVKPGRFWYAIAAVVIVVGIAAGITGFVVGMSSTVGSLPSMEKSFGSDTSTSVDLSEGSEWAVYVDHPGDSLPSGIDCSAESPSGAEATMTSPAGSFHFTQDGSNWHLAFEVTLPEPGEYEFTCTSGAQTRDFAVGEPVDVGGFMGGIFGSIGTLLGIPCLSFVVGGIIILVVALKRHDRKKRMQRLA